MDDRFERAKKRITSIIAQLKRVGWDFGHYYDNSYSTLPDNISEATGASREVFWDDYHDDFVLKVGLTPNDERFCEKEVEVYNAAVEAGLGDYFGWTARIGTVDGVGVYAMEFLCCDEERVCSDSYDYFFQEFCKDNGLDVNDEDAQDSFDVEWSCDEDYRSNDGIREWFLNELPWKTANILEDFLDNWSINDLHSGNVGYRGDALVFADYAGWGW